MSKVIGAAILSCLFILNTMPDMGRDYNAADVSKLTVGESTEADAVKLFGSPINRVARSDGSVSITYMFSQARPSAINLFGNTPGSYTSKSVIISFGPGGKLVDYTQTGE